VIELGNAIVRSFERESDRLSQWMAHRLAELMEAAEHGRTRADREAAAQQASDLILRLWRHRHQWPRGWPPGELGTLFERLHELETTPAWQRRRRSSHDEQPSWASALTELDRLGAAEQHIVMSAALVSMDAAEVQAWLNSSTAAGEDDEILEQVERTYEAARRRLSGRAYPRVSNREESQDELDLVALQKNALRELVELTSRRIELLKSIAEAQELPFPRAARKKRASQKAPDLG
jgi:hypothetical protein